MSRKQWVRLDNASNIFLAARSDIDPKVFRLSAQVAQDVDPNILQEALDTTYDRYPLYHAVLRRAVFWYYLQESDLRPQVQPDELSTCAAIYDPQRPGLLFRVLHHHNRIILEVFHALSDGTGGLWFLTDLLAEYVRRKYPDQPAVADKATAELTAQPGEIDADRELSVDSFTHYFRRKRGSGITESSEFEHRPAKEVHRVPGTPTPDFRTRAVELTMPAGDVLKLARAEGVSLTMYITALFFEAVRASSGGLGSKQTLAASLPVNLRQFFPSVSARNFFATVRVTHSYGEGPDDIGSVARHIEEQFRVRATPEALEYKVRRFIRFERSPLVRIVPRPIKDVVLKFINWVNNRGLTVALSNMGRVSLPEPLDVHVVDIALHVSAVRPQICVVSHNGQLVLTFSSPFVETTHIQAFTRLLTSQNVDITVGAAKVTQAELSQEVE